MDGREGAPGGFGYGRSELSGSDDAPVVEGIGSSSYAMKAGSGNLCDWECYDFIATASTN